MLRPIALALALPALRLARTPLRLASTSTAVLAHPEAEYEKFMQPLKAPGIRANAHAYVWEVPKDLPENDFIRRRQAVADHAESTTELWRKIRCATFPLSDICLTGANPIVDYRFHDPFLRRKIRLPPLPPSLPTPSSAPRPIPSFYICIPAIIVTALWVYKAEQAHEEHHKHIIEMNGGVEPERKVYSYMNMRAKPFPWGNQSLFFNPKTNIPAEEP